MTTTRSSSRSGAILAVALVCLTVAAVSYALFAARSWINTTYANESAQEEWTTWVEDVKEHGESGPVRRRVPKSSEPPGLVLLRDYFYVIWLGSVILSGALAAVFSFLLAGVMFASTDPPNLQDT